MAPKRYLHDTHEKCDDKLFIFDVLLHVHQYRDFSPCCLFKGQNVQESSTVVECLYEHKDCQTPLHLCALYPFIYKSYREHSVLLHNLAPRFNHLSTSTVTKLLATRVDRQRTTICFEHHCIILADIVYAGYVSYFKENR